MGNVTPEASPDQLTRSWYTFDEAAEMAGVSKRTIRRRWDDGKLPNATQRIVEGKPVWHVSARDLAALAEAENWVLQLQENNASASPETQLGLVIDQLREAVEDRESARIEAATFKTKLEGAAESQKRTDNQLKRANDDLDAERSARAKVEADLKEAHARIAEEVATSARLTAEASSLTDRVASLNDDIAQTATDLQQSRESADKAAQEAEQAARDADQARLTLKADVAARDAALGYFGRRRLAKSKDQ